jgi:hypothetical protein
LRGEVLRTKAALLWESPGKLQLAEVDLDPPGTNSLTIQLSKELPSAWSWTLKETARIRERKFSKRPV